MPHLQIKNITEELHSQLKRLAKKSHCTLNELAVKILEREVSHQLWKEQWRKLNVNDLGLSASALIHEERRSVTYP